MTLKRNMTLARMRDGRLVIHNAVALEPELMQRIESFGTPAILIVPNGYHRLDAPAYKRRYPALRVFAPARSRKKVEEVIAVHGSYEDFPGDDAVRLVPLPGTKDAEGAMLVRSQDGLTIVLNDAVFNMDRKRDFLGWFFTTLMGSAPGPRVSRLAKLTLISDKAALRGELERYAAMPDVVRLVVAHEKVASGPDARAALAQAATYL
jgi:hypothetical protein